MLFMEVRQLGEERTEMEVGVASGGLAPPTAGCHPCLAVSLLRVESVFVSAHGCLFQSESWKMTLSLAAHSTCVPFSC